MYYVFILCRERTRKAKYRAKSKVDNEGSDEVDAIDKRTQEIVASIVTVQQESIFSEYMNIITSYFRQVDSQKKMAKLILEKVEASLKTGDKNRHEVNFNIIPL
jgi:hypothetical protein